MEPVEFCVVATIYGDLKEDSACVKGLEMCLATSSSSTISGDYEAVVGLGQPTVTGKDFATGYPELDTDSFATNYVMQLYLQEPNY